MTKKNTIMAMVGAVVVLFLVSQTWTCFMRPWSRGRRALAAGDYSGAMIHFKRAAAEGDANAEFDLAGMYALGQGVKVDKVEATRLFQRAALKGDPWAAMALSANYAAGDGVAKNPAQAYRWILLASAPVYISEVITFACKLRCELEPSLTEEQRAKGRALAGIKKPQCADKECKCRTKH